MAEKKPTKKKKEDAPVEETVAEATETEMEAATPTVDEGAPMASTEAMDDVTVEAELEAVAEEAPAEEPVAEAVPEVVVEESPVEESPEEPVAEIEPDVVVEESPVEESPEEPVAEAEPEATVEEPPVEEPAPQEPVAEVEPEAVVEEPPVEEPALEEPVAGVEPEAVVEEPLAEEPLTEEAPAEEPAAKAPVAAAAPAAPAEPAPQSGPKPKRKRLPRALRPSTTKGRVKREKATERKPIVRIPKPEREFGRRQERLGTVVSDKGDKTIVVKVDTIKAHPRYKKVVRRSKRFHAHDEQNAAKIGDVVKIIETRPISKSKNWRLAEIVEAAK